MIENPLLLLAIGMVTIVGLIVVLRVHAFLSLMVAAMLVGVLTANPGGDGSQALAALGQVTEAFGKTAGSIGLIIVLATIIGKCLMDSGAAEAIARRFLRITGKEKAPLAMLGSGYALSIPVFFDTVFYLLIPLARALTRATGGQFAFFVMAICAGAGLTHSLVAPTPGPLIMADNLGLDLGVTILAGLAFSLLPGLLVGWFGAGWLSRRLNIPMRDTDPTAGGEPEASLDRGASELPSFFLSVLPIALPVLLIACASVVGVGHEGSDDAWRSAIAFLGDKNVALLIAMLVSVWILVRSTGISLREVTRRLEGPIASAGVIILITAAGGAFGAMIRHTGIGAYVQAQAGGEASGTLLLFIAFGGASLLKIAQGSSTVAMITMSAVMFGMIEGITLPFHPVYLFLSIGFGAMVFSWMNDSGFWIVSMMAGFTEREALMTWSLMFASMGIVGFVQVLIVANLLPLNFLP